MPPPNRAPDLLGRRARLNGEAVALIEAEAGGRTVTYRAWNARVNQTARVLAERHGVRGGTRVALLAGNAPAWLDVWMACGKLGAILQPLNWRLPPAALQTLIERADPVLLVHDETHRAAAEGCGGRRARRSLNELVEQRSGRGDDDLEGPTPTLDDPWVLCATGGTTGLPKMAILTHANLLWNAAGTAASWELHRGARALLNAPLFHTGGMNVFTLPLVWSGGTSIVCAGFDVDQLFDHVERGDITHFFGVPTMFELIVRHPRFDDVDLSGLELVISGGAPCPTPIFDAMWAKGVDFKTGYGLTEAGPNNFWLPRSEVRSRPGSVGYPLLHVEARIAAAADGVEAPPGEPGELLLRGPHVTPGYFADPEATDHAIDAEGWLHTGDLALRDDDGAYRVVGRKKDMYISGGENVYPAEIESVLHGHPHVVEVAVVGQPHPKWGEVGHAYVVSDDPGLDAAGLDAWLQDRLAKYQRPARISFVDALPKTGAGKIDKRALEDQSGVSDPGGQGQL